MLLRLSCSERHLVICHRGAAMHAKWMLSFSLAIALCGCAKMQGHNSQATREPDEPGETKVALEQVPEPARKTIQQQLASAELEDIARKQRNGKTIYETDIIKNGHKWEVIVAEDGSIISNKAEGDEEAKEDKAEARKADWRQKFDVNKSDLMPTGSNQYLPIQPGRVLKMRSGIDSLTISILSHPKEVDGVACGVLEERETKDG